MSGLLISFDGLDSSGKHTQAFTLAERLREKGFTVSMFQTPDYSTPSGQDLKARLQGKIGNWPATPWQEKLQFFANNRIEHRDEVLGAIDQGNIVIYDRYVPSSLAFMAIEAQAEGSEANREQIYDTVKDIEYRKNKMPVEDTSIFLDVSPDQAVELLQSRKAIQQDADEYTDELAVQQKLYEEYDHLCNADPDEYTRIRCVEDGKLLSISEVAELIWQTVTKQHPQLERRKHDGKN